jgi:hypothetical protein
MKKMILSTLAITALLMVSCNKKQICENEANFGEEIANERAQITVPESDYSINITDALVTSDDVDYYIDGAMDYVLDGQVIASVDFGDGTSDSHATITQNGVDLLMDMDIRDAMYDGKKSKYDRIIVRPLVGTDGCAYIVSGIIKYFDREDHSWVATIDYGDGTCDDLATKTALDGTYIFRLSDYK